jgi:hypothetical protein
MYLGPSPQLHHPLPSGVRHVFQKLNFGAAGTSARGWTFGTRVKQREPTGEYFEMYRIDDEAADADVLDSPRTEDHNHLIATKGTMGSSGSPVEPMVNPTDTSPLLSVTPTFAHDDPRKYNVSNSPSSQAESASSYSDFISKAGIGSFHYAFLAVCALANASDAVELLSISYVLPRVYDEYYVSGEFFIL